MASGLHLATLLLMSSICFAAKVQVKADGKVQTSCPFDWTMFEGRCFKFYSEPKTWEDAEYFCNDVGGHLVSIHSEEENSFVSGLGPKTRTWIGTFDVLLKSEWWAWSDASNFDYTGWAQGEPNNSGGDEGCVEINYFQGTGWNDVSCKMESPFVCVTWL